MKTKLPLPEAQKIAARVIDALATYCARIEVAGSIRRQSPQVGDIEIVCQPKTGTDLFGQPYPLPIPTEGLGRHEVSGERYRKIILPEGVQLDLFIVLPPAQWGVIFAIRTGGAEFSRRLVTSRLHGGLLPPQYVVEDGAVHSAVTNKIVPTPEESDFFALCGLDNIPPQERN
jgi:DNA polymerase/3'-5' exonuclease PolX